MINIRERVDILVGGVKETVEPITPELNLSSDLGIDSLGVIDLVTSIEEEFDLMLPSEVIERVQTVGDIYSSLEEILKDAPV